MNTFWIYYSSILLAVILTSIVLYFARPIFMPLALAGILALVFMRPSSWLERHGVPRLVTAILSGVFFAALVAGIVLLINWYIHRFAMDLPQLEKKVSGALNDARQFLPLVMREQVNLSPLFTIVCLIAGELLWGIPGMILAIPCLAIFKIACDEVEFLQAFGFLLGRSGKPGKGLSLKSLFHRKRGG